MTGDEMERRGILRVSGWIHKDSVLLRACALQTGLQNPTQLPHKLSSPDGGLVLGTCVDSSAAGR